MTDWAVTVEKKRTFNAVFKLEIIDCASQYSYRAAAGMHGNNEKRVRKWKKIK